MKKLIATLLVGFLFFAPAAVLAEKIVFGSSEWEPYLFSENGKVTGMEVEVILELCERLKIEAEIQALPWKRTLAYAEKGQVDAIFAARRNPEREKFLYYVSEPLLMERSVILARKGEALKVGSLDDLKGKSVGVVRGYFYSPEFDKYEGIGKEICDDENQLMKMFAKKRISLAAGADEGAIRYLCKRAGVEAEVVYVLNEAPSYLAFSKASLGEKGKKLAEKFDEALRQLKKDGFIENIQKKYF